MPLFPSIWSNFLGSAFNEVRRTEPPYLLTDSHAIPERHVGHRHVLEECVHVTLYVLIVKGDSEDRGVSLIYLLSPNLRLGRGTRALAE